MILLCDILLYPYITISIYAYIDIPLVYYHDTSIYYCITLLYCDIMIIYEYSIIKYSMIWYCIVIYNSIIIDSNATKEYYSMYVKKYCVEKNAYGYGILNQGDLNL